MIIYRPVQSILCGGGVVDLQVQSQHAVGPDAVPAEQLLHEWKAVLHGVHEPLANVLHWCWLDMGVVHSVVQLLFVELLGGWDGDVLFSGSREGDHGCVNGLGFLGRLLRDAVDDRLS